jgi:thiamine kinase-like enzyme
VIARFESGKHLTLIHGDPHIGNFLYPKDSGKDTLRILDWKSWEVEIGARDMAHKIAMFWYPERRRRYEVELLRRYHRRLTEFGVKGYEWDDLWHDYRLNVIRLLFHPVWQWGKGTPIDIWSSHLERLIWAYEDLGCIDLLE